MSFKYKDQAIADSNDIYSTDEVRIGTWIDGKPLYRRCFNLNVPSTMSKWISVYSIIKDFDNINFISAIIDNSGMLIPLPATALSGTQCKVLYDKASGILVYNNESSYVNLPLFVTLEYTKTTDQPGGE